MFALKRTAISLLMLTVFLTGAYGETIVKTSHKHSSHESSNYVGWLIIIFIVLFVYFFPSIVAGCRNHYNSTAIFVLNLFTGLTGLGWVVCLVWAFSNPPPQK